MLNLPQLTALFNDRETFLQMKRKELRSKEDDFLRHKRDLERQLAQLKREVDLPRNQNKPVTGDSELENLRVSINIHQCSGLYSRSLS